MQLRRLSLENVMFIDLVSESNNRLDKCDHNITIDLFNALIHRIAQGANNERSRCNPKPIINLTQTADDSFQPNEAWCDRARQHVCLQVRGLIPHESFAM